MTLKFVDSLPKRESRNSQLFRKENCLQGLINKFVNSGGKIARIDVGHNEGYKSIMSFYASVQHAVKLSRQNVRVVKRGHEVYLVKD